MSSTISSRDKVPKYTTDENVWLSFWMQLGARGIYLPSRLLKLHLYHQICMISNFVKLQKRSSISEILIFTFWLSCHTQFTTTVNGQLPTQSNNAVTMHPTTTSLATLYPYLHVQVIGACHYCIRNNNRSLCNSWKTEWQLVEFLAKTLS